MTHGNSLLSPRLANNSTDGSEAPLLRIYTLGRLSIERNGTRVEFRGKAQRRPLDLLCVLIAHGGREVSRQRLCEALWCESGDEDSVLGSTVHRLRNLLGDAEALEVGAGRVSLCSSCCWVDAWAFQRLVSSVVGNSEADLAEYQHQLLGLYHDQFLALEQERPWMIVFRQRLASKFLRVMVALGDNWEQRGEWNRAVDLYLQAIERDPLSETLHARLMRAYVHLQLPADAAVVYQRFAHMLRVRLGVEPGAQLQQLLKKTGAAPGF